MLDKGHEWGGGGRPVEARNLLLGSGRVRARREMGPPNPKPSSRRTPRPPAEGRRRIIIANEIGDPDLNIFMVARGSLPVLGRIPVDTHSPFVKPAYTGGPSRGTRSPV